LVVLVDDDASFFHVANLFFIVALSCGEFNVFHCGWMCCLRERSYGGRHNRGRRGKDCLSDDFVGEGRSMENFPEPSSRRVAISEIDLSDAERSQDESISLG